MTRQNIPQSVQRNTKFNSHPYITPPDTPSEDTSPYHKSEIETIHEDDDIPCTLQNSLQRIILHDIAEKDELEAQYDLSRSDAPLLRSPPFTRRLSESREISHLNFKNLSHDVKSRIPSHCFKVILEFLKDDISTLYTCLFVNFSVCQLVVPLLWRRPFHHTVSRPRSAGASLIQVYLSFLSDNEIGRLTDSGIHLRAIYKSSFNYAKHIQEFDSYMVERAIKDWIYVMNPRYSDSVHKIQIINQVLSNMLFRHSGGLDILCINPDYGDEKIFFDISQFPGARDALSKIRNFILDYHVRCTSSEAGVSKLVSMMSQYAHNLQHITIKIGYLDDPVPPNVYPTIIQSLSKLIKAQKALRSIEIENNWDPSKLLLIYSSIHSQSQNLSKLSYTGLLIPETFMQLLSACTKLDTLEFDGFYDLKKHSFADYVIPPNRFSIKHLSCRADLSSIHPFNATKADTLGIIIQIVNKNLRNLMLGGVTTDILNIIVTYCPNLTKLYIKGPGSKLQLFRKLLTGLKNLVELDLGDIHDDATYVNPIDLTTIKAIAESIPSCVQVLGIHFSMSSKGLRLFLENCEANIETISLFRNSMINDDILDTLVKYAKSKGTLRKISYFPEVWIRFGQNFQGFSEEALENAYRWIPTIGKETRIEKRIHGKLYFYLDYSFNGRVFIMLPNACLTFSLLRNLVYSIKNMPRYKLTLCAGNLIPQ
ncbi:7055_t:CDS:1 [Cetraspora pellucida]|uniref:7055_t:CDS:1 n=1 Tax=Cetraspora pellucida TaxID=1433469 RepID=A0A9N9IJI3_9GLOM|nr:7055_t:CDS:1 [Cetraspora pellucida]